MLEYTSAGDGARLSMLVLHDDGTREYAYGPALGLPETRVGTFPQALHDEARKQGWTVISMKNDIPVQRDLTAPCYSGGRTVQPPAVTIQG